MRRPFRARRSVVLSWLSVLVLLTSVFSWVPVAAQQGDGTPGESDQQTEVDTQTTAQQNDGQLLQEQDDTVEPVAMTITVVTIACSTTAGQITGSFTVIDPDENRDVELTLDAGTTELRSQRVALLDTQTQYPFTFTLAADDVEAGSSVTVSAVDEDVADAIPTTSAALAISLSGGVTVCGSASPGPTATATVAPTTTATATAPATATATATPPGTATGTPPGTATPDPAAALVAALVAILDDILSEAPTLPPVTSTPRPSTPTPTPPPSSGGTGTFGTVVNVDQSSLRCRTAPVNGGTITMLAQGARLETRGAASNGWVPVICGGQNGFVSASYFRIEGQPAPTPPPPSGGSSTAMVSGTGGSGVRCRTAPNNGSVITTLPEGAQVDTRGASSDGWVPVRCGGQNGWVSAVYLLIGSGGGSGTLWIDINLSTQYMRVYRGNEVIIGTYISSGRVPKFTTPTGTFYINRKLTSQTMSGVLGGESYHVPNVPWVMYFTNRGHAIHGAYWHNDFGTPRSHGCINLPVPTAKSLYGMTPVGTRVVIHY